MLRHRHYLTYTDLQGLLDLPEDELVLTVQVDPATRTIFLDVSGGPDVPDLTEGPILPHDQHDLTRAPGGYHI